MMNMVLEDPEQEMKYQAQIWSMCCGHVNSSVLKCTLELSLLDTIHQNSSTPVTLSSLAASSPSLSSLNTQNLYRLLRYLSHMDLISINSCQGIETFSLTEPSKLLLKNQERSVEDWVIGIDGEHSVNNWHELSNLCTWMDNSSLLVKLHGKTFWELAEEDPEVNALINKAMASDTRIIMPAFVQGCEKILNGIKKLVDIGGGTGAALTYVVRAFPEIKCTVLDLPHVVATAPEIPGVDMVGGDMFQFIPPADALLMKFMLHNWNDEECIKLLKKCKETIPADQGKVIIIEMVLDQDEDDDDLTQVRLSFDLDVMLCTGGIERTKNQWRILLEKGGFSKVDFIPLFAIQSVIVAYP